MTKLRALTVRLGPLFDTASGSSVVGKFQGGVKARIPGTIQRRFRGRMLRAAWCSHRPVFFRLAAVRGRESAYIAKLVCLLSKASKIVSFLFDSFFFLGLIFVRLDYETVLKITTVRQAMR